MDREFLCSCLSGLTIATSMDLGINYPMALQGCFLIIPLKLVLMGVKRKFSFFHFFFSHFLKLYYTYNEFFPTVDVSRFAINVRDQLIQYTQYQVRFKRKYCFLITLLITWKVICQVVWQMDLSIQIEVRCLLSLNSGFEMIRSSCLK